ncbi:MAG: hypothetical protein ACFFDN_25995 [Candidatus Hodarchaeota archaeon]
MKDRFEFKKLNNKPTLSFFCIKCNLFFGLDDGITINEAKCPNCETYEILIGLEFDSNTPQYYT